MIDTELLEKTTGLERLEQYCSFDEESTYVVYAMARFKENEHITGNSTPVFREPVWDELSLNRAYRKMQALAESYTLDSGESGNFRLYVTVNRRDVQRALYMYQKRIAELVYKQSTNHQPSLQKLNNLSSVWKSTLLKNENRADEWLLADVDTTDETEVEHLIDELKDLTTIRGVYPTPNGYHIITKKFEYPLYTALEEREYLDFTSDDLLFIEKMF